MTMAGVGRKFILWAVRLVMGQTLEGHDAQHRRDALDLPVFRVASHGAWHWPGALPADKFALRQPGSNTRPPSHATLWSPTSPGHGQPASD